MADIDLTKRAPALNALVTNNDAELYWLSKHPGGTYSALRREALRELAQLTADVRREAKAEALAKLRENIAAFCDEVEYIARRRETRPGGQHVTETNPLFYIQPSALKHLHTWARQFRSDLEEQNDV